MCSCKLEEHPQLQGRRCKVYRQNMQQLRVHLKQELNHSECIQQDALLLGCIYGHQGVLARLPPQHKGTKQECEQVNCWLLQIRKGSVLLHPLNDEQRLFILSYALWPLRLSCLCLKKMNLLYLDTSDKFWQSCLLVLLATAKMQWKVCLLLELVGNRSTKRFLCQKRCYTNTGMFVGFCGFFFGGRGKNFDVFLNGKDWPKIYRRFDSYYLNATIIPKLKIVFFILLLIIAEAKVVPYWKWLWPCPQASSKRETPCCSLDPTRFPLPC